MYNQFSYKRQEKKHILINNEDSQRRMQSRVKDVAGFVKERTRKLQRQKHDPCQETKRSEHESTVKEIKTVVENGYRRARAAQHDKM